MAKKIGAAAHAPVAGYFAIPRAVLRGLTPLPEATRKEVQRLKMDRAELLAKLSSQQQAEGGGRRAEGLKDPSLSFMGT